MSKDLVTVKTFVNSIEAELAKNYLESNGIYALMSHDNAGGMEPGLNISNGIHLIVRAEDKDRAMQLLEGAEDEDGHLSEADQHEINVAEAAQSNAAQEFEEIKLMSLKDKVARKNASLITFLVVIALSVAVYFFLPSKALAPRLALAGLFYAVIEFFIWCDARQAEKKLGGKLKTKK